MVSCVCMCVREREGEREGGQEGARVFGLLVASRDSLWRIKGPLVALGSENAFATSPAAAAWSSGSFSLRSAEHEPTWEEGC